MTVFEGRTGKEELCNYIIILKNIRNYFSKEEDGNAEKIERGRRRQNRADLVI